MCFILCGVLLLIVSCGGLRVPYVTVNCVSGAYIPTKFVQVRQPMMNSSASSHMPFVAFTDFVQR